MPVRRKLLVTDLDVKDRFPQLSRYADVFATDELDEDSLDSLLPTVDSLLVTGLWPKSLRSERMVHMKSLRFVQLQLAGANHVPFRDISREVVVCSNAGGYSLGVAEFAWGLLLAAAKRVVSFDANLRADGFSQEFRWRTAKEVAILKGKTLAIVGYGGIGRTVASIGRAFGMKVCAFARHPKVDRDTKVYRGKQGLLRLLRVADVVVVAIPLTNRTKRLIGARELAVMKPNAIMVNVARAEILDENELYRHLVRNPAFVYATDVWPMVGGSESYSSSVPFLKLPNFIGTPHVSGPSELSTGEPMRLAVENLLRHFRGEAPSNVVDRSEYT